MDPSWIQSIVEEVVQQLNKQENMLKPNHIPIAVSARHVHLSKEHLAILFGPGHQLKKRIDLSQPNQYAAEETVTIAGPKGSIERVRVLGPSRSQTQVEISLTDSLKLGVKPPIRQSGNIEESAPVTIIGPKGSVFLQQGMIIAQAHIHMSPEEAERFRVKDGEYVQVTTGEIRPVSFGRVLVRVSSSYQLEMHIDTDEGNAGFIQRGQTGHIIKLGDNPFIPFSDQVIEDQGNKKLAFKGTLLSQNDVAATSEKVIHIEKRTIVTPLAKDTARDLGIRIEVIES